MTGCLKKETLLAFVDRELPAGEMESAELHVAVCGECKAELESLRATSVKVNALLSSLASEEMSGATQLAVISIPERAVTARNRWVAVASIGVVAIAAGLLLLAMRRPHSAPQSDLAKSPAAPLTSVVAERKPNGPRELIQPVNVSVHKTRPKVRKFQALDDGEPIQTGMIYRVSLPAPTSADGLVSQSTKRIPAEVIVDDFGKVRAIRFLQ
jgi:anti-sigma factor RsiW